MYKNSVIRDKDKVTGYNFIMYYNARGDSINPAKGAERIAKNLAQTFGVLKRPGHGCFCRAANALGGGFNT